MGTVIAFPKRNIRNATTAELKTEWDKWADDPNEDMTGHIWHYEAIHAELNRRGEGAHCAV
jgi:hypothetical protein